MNNASYPAYLELLNPRQREAILHSGGPLLILAGAGSGKTRVITTKIAFAIDVLALDPHEILAVTFTNKAAGEMKERLAALTPHAPKVLVRTFHSFGAWILRRYGRNIGIAPSFLIYDEDDALSLLKTDLKTHYSLNEIKQFLRWIMRAKDLCLSPDDPLGGITSHHRFPQIYAAYEEHLRQTGNLDFGDLIIKSVRLLASSDFAQRDFFRMILVDEYQDSNVAQYELLKQLYNDRTSLCVVGDDDQSIYGFRGAQVDNILTFPESFPGTTIIRLEENYRSTKKILAAAGSVVANNVKRLGKTLFTNNEEGENIRLAIFANHTDEALFAADLVEDDPFTETAILYRMNYQSRHFEEVFTRRKIPYLLVGALRFYEREEIKDVLAYLALLVNPCDNVAAKRIINRPARGIGQKSAEKFFSRLEDYGGDVMTALEEEGKNLSLRARKSVKAFVLLLSSLKERLPSLLLSRFMHDLIVETGLYDLYSRADIAQGTTKTKNLEELVNAAASYGMGREALLEFLENIMLNLPEYDDRPPHRVTLITLHNTKGLEFERVIITGCEEGVFPVLDRDEGEEGIEEERRLFYVGLTRAKRSLILTSCKSRLLFGNRIETQGSRFLKEIPAGVLAIDDNIKMNTDEESAFPPGSRVHSDDYGSGYVIKNETKEEQLVLMIRFDSGRVMKILPRYHDLMRIREE